VLCSGFRFKTDSESFDSRSLPRASQAATRKKMTTGAVCVGNGRFPLPLTWKVCGVMYHHSSIRVSENMVKSAGMNTVVVSVLN